MTASLAGAFLGWCAAFGLHVLVQVYGSGFGHVTDHTFWLYSTSLTVGVWWAVTVVPAMCVRAILVRLQTGWLAVPLGALHGVIGFVVLVGWMAGLSGYNLAFAAIVGAATGLVVRLVLGWSRSRSADPVRSLPVILLGVPPAAIIVWSVVWSMVCASFPHVQYVFGDWHARDHAVRRVLSKVRVGDRYEVLQKMLPEHFREIVPVGYAGSTSSHGSNPYTITVKNGVITDVEFVPP